MLDWRSARPEHKPSLERFVCTNPAKQAYEPHRGKHHPKPWELEVQSHLRGLRLPVATDEFLALGFDDQGLAAAVHFGLDDTNAQFMIWTIGCAVRCRGNGHGREGIDVTLGVMARTKARFGMDCGVFTHIDPRNEPSRVIFKAAGFEYLDVYDGYEAWVRDI